MSGLPEIPSAAYDAVVAASWATLPGDAEAWTREILGAAWPTLYATAHAAGERDALNRAAENAWFGAATQRALRSMAEAVA